MVRIVRRWDYSHIDAPHLSLTDVRMFYWTDLYTALCWIKNQKPENSMCYNR